jgi:ADP-ribose pyrophosphatase
MAALHSRVVWEDSWRLRVDTVQLPNGRTIERAAVEHPGSVVLVPLLEHSKLASALSPQPSSFTLQPSSFDPHVLMLRQYRFTLQQSILELPAGTRDWEEPWLECAQRELREETGYRAAEFIPLGHVWPAPGITGEEMAIFLALGLTADPLPADEDEEIVLEVLALTELVEMAVDGRLQDAKSAVAILRTAAYLSGNPLGR